MMLQSRPAWGAWIEIFPPAVRDPDGPRRTPRGVRGLKSRCPLLFLHLGRRAPHGARGLKFA